MPSNIEMLIEQLQNPNPGKRYEACEELRVSSSLPDDAIDALRRTTRDENPDVADAAQRALDLHAPTIPEKPVLEDSSPSEPLPSQPYVSPPMPSGSPNSPEYVFALEKRVMVLEMELMQLAKETKIRTTAFDPEITNAPKSMVMSPNFLERAFAIWGHYLVAQLFIAKPFILLSIFLAF